MRAGMVNAKTSPIRDEAVTSEANQWKVHKTGQLVATSNNQTFTIEHGLPYTPAFLVFRKLVANDYYKLFLSPWIDKTTLTINMASTGDKATYVIFKDFGA